jgi:hypothetical protein
MPQFQILVIFSFCMAIFVNWIVFGGTTFNVGLTPIIAVVFLLASVSAVCWVFFTPSGKNAARSYNKQVEQVALAERENLKQAQTEFKEDIELIEKDINSAKTNTLLEERIISNLTKEINVMGIKTIFFSTLALREKLSSLKLLLSTFPNNSHLQDFAFTQMQKPGFSSGQAYELALEVLAENPGQPKAKQFVLRVGRWHFGKVRKGTATIYDEQAIQNDIQVRLT